MGAEIALSQFVRSRLVNLGRSSSDLAELLGIAPSTMRSYLKRNEFPEEVVDKLPGLLQDEAANFRERFTYRPKRPYRQPPSNPEQSFREQVKRERRRLSRLATSQGELVRVALQDLISTASQSDRPEKGVFCYIALDQKPYEAVPQNFSPIGELIAEAVWLGVRFCYITPTAKLTLHLVGEKFHVPINHTKKVIDGLKDKVEKYLTVKHGVEEAAAAIERIRFFLADDGPFFTPGHKYLLFSYPQGIDPPFLATAVVPVDGHDLHVPLDGDKAGGLLLEYCDAVVGGGIIVPGSGGGTDSALTADTRAKRPRRRAANG